MTNSNERDIQALLAQLATSQLETQAAIRETQLAVRETQSSIQATQNQILETHVIVRELTSDVDQVLRRSAVLDDVLLRLDTQHEQHQLNFERHQQNFEQHQRNFVEYQRLSRETFNDNQRSTNAALERLEAILLKLLGNND